MPPRNFRIEFNDPWHFYDKSSKFTIACSVVGEYDAQMTKISKKQWLIAIAAGLAFTFFSAGFTAALLKSGFGSSEVAGWVQAIGATIGIGIAVWVPYQQRENAVRDEKVRSFHHALAVVDDLRGRVTGLQKTFAEGGRPLAFLTSNCAKFLQRYESLYDRELYTYLPGPIVNQITDMSGSFAGIETIVAATAARFENKPNHILPPRTLAPPPGAADPFEALFQKLDDLYTSLEGEAQAIAR